MMQRFFLINCADECRHSMPAHRNAAVYRLFAALLLLSVQYDGLNAHAQAYPVKAVRMVVPFTPGSATDVIARMIAPQLEIGRAHV